VVNSEYDTVSAVKAMVDEMLGFKSERKRSEDAFTAAFLISALNDANGNVTKAARAVGLSRCYMHRLMRRHNVKASHFRKKSSPTLDADVVPG
jgi:transcriptional regulator of acetoin/glycerol metabolism